MLYEALKTMRVFHDLTQKDLADRLGISKSYLSEIENGKKVPALNLLEQYADIFEVPLSSILFFSENMGTDSPSAKARSLISSKVLALMRFIAERSGKSHAE